MDYSSGKAEFDLGMCDTQITTGGPLSEGLPSFGSKYNFDGAVTVGLGNNFAVQYKYFSPQSQDFTYDNILSINMKMTNNEFNVLYKVDNNVAAFVGYINSKAQLNVNLFTLSGTAPSNTQNIWQIGVVGSTPIAEKTTLWASAAAGSHVTNLAVGVGYEFSPGWEFNVGYRDLVINKYDFNGINGTMDGTAKGLDLGVSCKF